MSASPVSQPRDDARPRLWIDASAGASGDMLLGGLLDAGASLDAVRAAIARLGVEPIGLTAREVRRHGLRATKADVVAGEAATERDLEAILTTIRTAGLSAPVAAFAERVFRLLVAAEARVHGRLVAETHLHEAGALDALADVVGTAAALEDLGLLDPGCRTTVGPVAVGGGSIETAHGPLPIPAPAVLEILATAGAPVTAGDGTRELCTPTGAAILAAVAGDWGDLPPMRVRRVGVGAGTADPPGRPNVLRVVVGVAPASDDATEGRGWRTDELFLVESTVDDLEPRLWPAVLDALVAAGAADAWLTPVVMRKGRPGHVVSALAGASVLDAVSRALFAETTTLGLRTHAVARRALARDEVVVEVDGRPIHVKRGLLDGRPVTLQPEYADVAAAAEACGTTVRSVLERAAALARGS